MKTAWVIELPGHRCVAHDGALVDEPDDAEQYTTEEAAVEALPTVHARGGDYAAAQIAKHIWPDG